jgi:hypothetical protein
MKIFFGIMKEDFITEGGRHSLTDKDRNQEMEFNMSQGNINIKEHFRMVRDQVLVQ